jgi:peptidyl-prolyl cis-trans isomerase SurA
MTHKFISRGFHVLVIAAGLGLFLSGAFFCSAHAELLDRIVAVVNDDIILLSDLQEKMRPYVQKLESMGYPPEQESLMRSKLRKDFIDRLIDETLTDQQIKTKGISVSESEVENAIERMKEIRSLTDEQLRKGLKSEGLTMEAYRKQMREQLLRAKLLDYEVKSKIVVTEEDIRKYYEDHLGEFGEEKKYHLRTIVMRVPSFADEDTEDAVRLRMEEVYQKLKQGADFAELARRYSESSLAADGGDLGLFLLEDMSAQIRQAIEDKSEGEITPILDTGRGYQIFYVEDIVTTEPRALEEVSADIQNRLYQERVDGGFSAWLEDLRGRSYIKVIQ